MSSPTDDGARAETPSATPVDAPVELPRRGETLQALLMLLPAAVLAWPGPGSFLRDDFDAAETGAAVVLLATLPALALLVLRKHAGAARGWFTLLPLLLAGGQFFGSLGEDGFAKHRVVHLVVAMTGLVLCGASLGSAGRRVLARGLVVLALAYTFAAHFDAERAFTGALGNSGSVSHAALAGAVVSAVWIASGARAAWALVCALAFASYAVFVARLPVFAGVLACAFGLGAFALAARGSSRRTRAVAASLGVVVIAVASVFAVVHEVSEHGPAAVQSAPSSTPQPNTDAGDTGGFAVRVHVWRGALRLAAAHPFLGVGPGQFAREFPPFRAPAEIELSSHRRRLAQETEVEHAHSDYLTLLAEGGVLGAGPALALLVLVAFASWRALRSARPAGDVTQALLATAALALLANAAVHGVLFHDPVSASLAAGIFGALLGPVTSTPVPLVRRLVPGALLALALLSSASALAVLRHARALAPIHAGRELSSDATERAISDALAAVPDSPPALSLRARLLESRRAEPELVAAAWRDVWSVRPNRVEVNMQLGLALVESGARDDARVSWDRAQELDPHHPGLLWNRVALALERDRAADAAEPWSTLDQDGRADRARLAQLAARLEIEGHSASANFGWERALPDVLGAGPDKTFQIARERRDSNDGLVASALELRAQLAWAREHANAGRWDDAVRSYRQVLRLAATGGRTPSARFVFECAAAISLAGKDDEAQRAVSGLALDDAAFAELPDWARAHVTGRGWRAATGR